MAATQVLEAYDFNQIAVLYTTNDVQFCDGVIDDFEVFKNNSRIFGPFPGRDLNNSDDRVQDNDSKLLFIWLIPLYRKTHVDFQTRVLFHYSESGNEEIEIEIKWKVRFLGSTTFVDKKFCPYNIINFVKLKLL